MELEINENMARLISESCNSESMAHMGREEWKAARKDYIGGSESFAFGYKILGAKPKWSTPFSVWAKKNGHGKDVTSAAMTNGINREPHIRSMSAQLIVDQTGEKVQVYETPYLYTMEQYPFIAANLDGLVQDENGVISGLEIKTSGSMDGWHDNDIPDVYWCQLQHYMMVTGLDHFYVVAEINGRHIVRVVMQNTDFVNRLMLEEVRFWQDYIMTRVMPPMVGADCETEFLDSIHRECNEESVEVPELQEIAKEYIELSSKEKVIKERKSQLQLEIKAAIGNAKSAMMGNMKASWLRIEKDSFDVAAFKEAHPQTYAQFTKKTEYTQLRVKEV